MPRKPRAKVPAALRKRTPLACMPCRLRKRKCRLSSNSTCHNCAESGTHCLFDRAYPIVGEYRSYGMRVKRTASLVDIVILLTFFIGHGPRNDYELSDALVGKVTRSFRRSFPDLDIPLRGEHIAFLFHCFSKSTSQESITIASSDCGDAQPRPTSMCRCPQP